MVAELCGAKLLAPVFGSSLYVWAAVMAVTLFALATGYFYGGRLSRKSSDLSSSLFKILIAASILILLMPFLASFVIPYIRSFSFIGMVLLSTSLLLFLPVFFLGTSSPLFISIQSEKENNAGTVSGTVYAISTLGGITSTLLSGFFFIPELGLKTTLLGFGILLFCSAFICLKKMRFMSMMLAVFALLSSFISVENKQILLYSSDGVMGLVTVEKGKMKDKEMLYLKVNGIVQSEMFLSNGQSASAYIQLLDSNIHSAHPNSQALILGVGGGLTTNLLVDKNYSVTGVEFDPRILFTAEKYFSMKTNGEMLSMDARLFINQNKKKFDLVLIDLYKAEEPPSHVVTIESLHQLSANMNPSSIIYMNWHGYSKGSLGAGTKIMKNTLEKSGFFVKLISYSQKEDERNIVFVASKDSLRLQDLKANVDLSGNEDLLDVNTDDKPVLEKYNALANLRWRALYFYNS